MFGSAVFYMDVSWYIVSLASGLRRFALDAKQQKRPLLAEGARPVWQGLRM